MLMEDRDYFFLEIKWNKTGDPFCPYVTSFQGQRLQIRVNDFPAEPMYSLLINNKSLKDFDEWPSLWKR